MKQRITKVSATLATMSLFCLAAATAQITETILIPGDGEERDEAGFSVSISRDLAIVGAYQDDDNGTNSGSAYIFQFDGVTWVEQTKLVATDGAASDNFGYSVSISSEYALIGAPQDDNLSGSVYFFRLDGSNWVQHVKLVASDGEQGDNFGSSVSIDGDYAIIGAKRDDYSQAEDIGSAYIFHLDGSAWTEQARIFSSTSVEGDQFGSSVSLSGNNILVGAPFNSRLGATASGAAHIFHNDGEHWIEQAKLYADDAASGDYFGRSVSISGNNAIVGAEGEDLRAGCAYVFQHNGVAWVEHSRLVASDPYRYEYFGRSVSLSGDYAIVGARSDFSNGANTGSAYIFHFDGSNWTEQTKLTASDGGASDYFGESVSLSGDYAIVGAYGHDDGGTNSGAAYVYSATPLCSKVSQFQARCRPGGLIKARVTMTDASHEGDIIEISIDDTPYEVTIDASGRGQLSQGGFSPGPHTVELTNPGQCFDPIVVTCRTSLDEEANDDWGDELISESPMETALLGNYPNPFNPSTTIRYVLSADGPVSVRVYNMLGQEVATLVDGFQKAGEQSVVWHGTNNFGQSVASGLYIYRLQTGSTVIGQKMLFAK